MEAVKFVSLRKSPVSVVPRTNEAVPLLRDSPENPRGRGCICLRRLYDQALLVRHRESLYQLLTPGVRTEALIHCKGWLMSAQLKEPFLTANP